MAMGASVTHIAAIGFREGFFADDHLDGGFSRSGCPGSGGGRRNTPGGFPRGCGGATEHYSNDGHRQCHDDPHDRRKAMKDWTFPLVLALLIVAAMCSAWAAIRSEGAARNGFQLTSVVLTLGALLWTISNGPALAEEGPGAATPTDPCAALPGSQSLRRARGTGRAIRPRSKVRRSGSCRETYEPGESATVNRSGAYEGSVAAAGVVEDGVSSSANQASRVGRDTPAADAIAVFGTPAASALRARA